MKAHRLRDGARFGDYTVETLIGAGSMGTVYRVVDDKGQPWALKMMKSELALEPGFNERFVQEAKIGEKIHSPYVVWVRESGIDEESELPFFVMELVAGRDLETYLNERGPLGPPQAKTLITQLFAALGAAHRSGVVHRDLKPENMLVMETDGQLEVKILDFGVAKVVREVTLAGTGTTPGLGTPLWTAPEQAKEGQRIRPRSDVWSLGLLTFRILANRPYWRCMSSESTTAYDAALEIIREPIVKASARASEIGASPLPQGFDEWFEQCVNRDPEKRFPNARDAYDALVPLLEPSAPSRRSTADARSDGVSLDNLSPRARFAFSLVGAVALMTLMTLLWVMWV